MTADTAVTGTHVYRKWIGFIWLFIEVNIASMTIYGFPALFEVLSTYGIFDSYCHSSEVMNATDQDCSGQTQQYQDALTLGIIFFNIPSMFIGIIIDAWGARFMKLIGLLFHIIGWLSLALLTSDRSGLLYVHTLFTSLSGKIVLLTSYTTCNYFSKSRPIVFTLLVGSSSAASIWYSVFQVMSIINKNLLTLSQLSYIWLSFGALLLLSSFLFFDWKFAVLNLPYKFIQESTSTTTKQTNDPSVEIKWYTKIRQRTGIWEHLTNPLYILAVLYLSFLMIPNSLLSVTWYPWVYFINNNDKTVADRYTFALNMSSLSSIGLCPIIGFLLTLRTSRGLGDRFGTGCIYVMPLDPFMGNLC
ncbi:unnamed protein product [Rotaria magnacalcarata]|uniref:Uncharacterized protein n=1 Tax=Rotaria magnacalcarata TaxID=392030 RepID=A0A819DLJ0_9BILA|nr:unnamed protein product [Rotaria magnacalcarata]